MLPANATELPGLLSDRILAKEISTQFHLAPITNQLEDLLFGPEDCLYISPTKDDIEAFLKFYRWRREGLPYLPEGWDCDNFSSEAKYLADVWAVRYYSHTPAAIAVGKAYVKLDGDVSDIFPGAIDVHGYHVLNVIRRSDGQWLFFEPQSGRMVPIESMIYEGGIEVLKVTL